MASKTNSFASSGVVSSVINFLKSNPSAGRRVISAKFGITEGAARTIVENYKQGKYDEQADLSLSKAISALDFRRQFDIPQKIKDLLPALRGKIIADSDFRTEAKVSPDKWRAAANRDEFRPYQIKIKDKVFWGHPKDLQEIRETIDVL